MAEAAHHAEKHEPPSISVPIVLWSVGAFFIFSAICVVVLYFYYASYRIPAPEPRAFPKPALERTPLLDLQTLERRQRAKLEGYAWVDRKSGIARIPIERAEQMIVASGKQAYEPPANLGNPYSAQATAPSKAAAAQPAPKEGHP